jgi:integrase/recombinase XerD
LFELFKKDIAVRGFTPRSQESYAQDLKEFIQFVKDHQLQGPTDLTLGFLQRYQTLLHERPGFRAPHLGLSTQARYLTIVRMFCRFLYSRGLILIDPGQRLQIPRIHRKLPAVILTTGEVLRFLKAIDTRTPRGILDRAVFETLYSTGIRICELAALTPADVDLEQGFLRVRKGKGGKARVIPLGRIAADWIQRYLQAVRNRFPPTMALFLTIRNTTPLNRTQLSQRVRAIAQKAGLKKRITCHTFRHTCATHMLRGRASLRHIQELLGHAKADTTQIYTHVEILDLKRVHQRCHPRSRR